MKPDLQTINREVEMICLGFMRLLLYREHVRWI